MTLGALALADLRNRNVVSEFCGSRAFGRVQKWRD